MILLISSSVYVLMSSPPILIFKSSYLFGLKDYLTSSTVSYY